MSTQSLVATCRSITEVFDHFYFMKEMYRYDQGVAIRGCDTRVDLVGAIVAFGSMALVLRIGTL